MVVNLIKVCKAENDQCIRIINSIRDRLTSINHAPNELVLSMNDLVKMYERIIERNNKQIKVLIDKINSLEGIEAKIMKLRYMEGLIWQDIADRLYISIQTAHRHHKKAMGKLQEK